MSDIRYGAVFGYTEKQIEANWLWLWNKYILAPVSVLQEEDDYDDFVYLENRVELRQLASNELNENPKLERLQRTLVDQFRDKNSRGIIFAKTREITRCLYDWVHTNPELRHAKIRAANLVGAGNGATHMTQVGP